jgi:processive 1,2-diacylglycerol beta-glucosyltransferase/1,2-diacylglycerol 3-beta-galactosyltransferase
MRHYSSPYLAQQIREIQPDRIVVLHFLLIRPLRHALRKLGKTIPSITVITDPFIAHPLWLYRQWMPLIVFSDSLKKQIVQQYRFEEKAVTVFPPILRSEYRRHAAERDTAALKHKLGFSPDKPLILIAGGGEGLPRGGQFLKAVLASSINSSVAFVCGKNTEQHRRVRRIVQHYPAAECRVYGFIDFMFDLMSAADIVVTKAGPATIMEALILEKPLILTEYIYGQERGNVDFVLRNRLGYFVDKPREITEKIRRLIGNRNFYRSLRRRIDRCGIENGTEKITDFILRGDWECRSDTARRWSD